MRQKIVYIVTVLVTLFIGFFGGAFIYKNYLKSENTEIVKKEEVKTVSVTENDTIQPGIEKIYNAVYYIASYKNKTLSSSGTGFVYKKDSKYGYIITNHHVINGATSVMVTSTSGATLEAKVLGSDEYADIAVLAIDVDGVEGVESIGDSTSLKLGDTLFTVGSPLGIEYIGTVTKGILSGTAREVSVKSNNTSVIMEVIQTDAAISPGNSGGPLCNINGEVIGVNSLKIVDENVEGMGFAIPIEIVMGLTDRLEKGEAIVRPYLGVTMTEITDEWNLYREGIKIDDEVENGVVITSVEDGSPADIAGLKKGDVIASVDNVKVKSSAHFRYLLYKYDVGDTITVKCYRDSKFKEIKIKLTKSLNEA